jgi:hypothetical protein
MASSITHSATSTLHKSSDHPPTHNSERADLSFREQTTNVQYAGFTDEYRDNTRVGVIPADQALKAVLSPVLKDAKKAMTLKNVELVTWKEQDPEDPRQWSNSYRWCESSQF